VGAAIASDVSGMELVGASGERNMSVNVVPVNSSIDVSGASGASSLGYQRFQRCQYVVPVVPVVS